MGKDYKNYEGSYIGGVAPAIQSNMKDLKKTSFNKEIEHHRKKTSSKKK